MVKKNPINLQRIQVARKGVTVIKKGKRPCLPAYAFVSPVDSPESPDSNKTPMPDNLSDPNRNHSIEQSPEAVCQQTDVFANRPDLVPAEPVSELVSELTADPVSDLTDEDFQPTFGGGNTTRPTSAVSPDPVAKFNEENANNPWRTKTIRVGCGDFLNQIPLNYKLKETGKEFGLQIERVGGSTGSIIEKMSANEIDAGMVSLVDYFQHPEFPISSDSCLSSEGVVRSILLYGRNSPTQIKTIAVERRAAIGAVMAQILLAEQFGTIPEIRWLVHSENWQATTADAVILNEERALRQPSRGEEFTFVWDMGQRWTQWTGVPFVYNIWVARDNELAKLLAPVLSQARDQGQEYIREIAIAEALRLKIDPEFCLDYLSHKLTMRLAGRQRKGIEIFCRLAKKHGLIDIGSPIPFNNHLRFRPNHEKPGESTNG